MNVERAFSPDPRSVRDARQFVSEHLTDADATRRERAVLLVSELGSNAVRHAGTGFLVVVGRRGPGVLVEVSDDGPGIPSMQDRDTSKSSGRGLQLVHDLAEDWGVRRGQHGRKTVWFTV
jgi:two-component sensor histidine kinase